MGWVIGLAAVAVLLVVGLVMAARGQAAAREFAETRGWRYEKTGPETFRIWEPTGAWVLTYGRGPGADGGRGLAFEFALPPGGEAVLMPRALHGLLTKGVTGAMVRGLDALPGGKAGVALHGAECFVDWVRNPSFAREFVLVGDPSALRPALGEDAAARLVAYTMPRVPTLTAKHGRCRVILNVPSAAYAIEALPEFADLGRSMLPKAPQ